MSKYWYVTVGSTKSFLTKYTQYALKSLLQTGVSPDDVYCGVSSDEERRLIKSLVPGIKQVSVHKEDLSKVVWKYANGKRKYSLFKAGAMYHLYGKSKPNRYMIQFDGDVLFYKNPEKFFDTKNQKTWFHHGKSLAKRSKVAKSLIDVTNFNSLSRWVSKPCAHLMVKYGAKTIPDREVVAGFYLLHFNDHESLLKLTYQGCLENASRFARHEGGGEQKPFNAALSILNIKWHGGSRFFCPEHEKYFDHFFGSKLQKKKMQQLIKEMNL